MVCSTVWLLIPLMVISWMMVVRRKLSQAYTERSWVDCRVGNSPRVSVHRGLDREDEEVQTSAIYSEKRMKVMRQWAGC